MNIFSSLQKLRKEKNRPLCGLAPMEGVNDYEGRLLYYITGLPEFAITPFFRVNESAWICPQDHLPEIYSSYPHIPTIPQIMAPSSSLLIPCAKELLLKVSLIDINIACPAPMVVKHGSGSALLKNPEKLEKILLELEEHLGPQNYSLKIRIGIEKFDEFYAIVKKLQKINPAWITIHPRTAKQMYQGKSNWDAISLALQELSSPIIASGDITTSLEFQEACRKYPSLLGIIIGRASFSNPFIFSEILEEKQNYIDIRKIASLYIIFIEHVKNKSLFKKDIIDIIFKTKEKDLIFEKIIYLIYKKNISIENLPLDKYLGKAKSIIKSHLKHSHLLTLSSWKELMNEENFIFQPYQKEIKS